MNFLSLRKDNLDELVFANRNKLYGAYALRRNYESHLVRGTFATIAFFLLIFAASYLRPAPETPAYDPFDQVIAPTKLSDLVLVIEPQVAPKPPVTRLEHSRTDNGRYEITHRPVPDELPQQRPTPQPAEGGTPGEGTAVAPTGNPAATPSTIPAEGTAAPTFETFVEIMPEYPGGVESMMRFLQSHMQYPSQAYQAGVEGKVLLSFIVEKDGTISHIQVERRLGFGCDEEAMRVVALMPKWVPGRQNGKNVCVKFSLPVRFALQ